MTRHSLFYFVNADGSGHARRAQAILPHLNVPVVVASEKLSCRSTVGKEYPFCQLPTLRSTGDRELADDVLHIPYGKQQVYLERVKQIIDHCQQHRCALAVIDVCVETAMVMRLCGIPYLYMRMSGQRDDAAHRQCYRAASGLIASYPQLFEEAWVPQWMRQKTCYVGGIFTTARASTLTPVISQRPYVLVMRGKGSSQLTPGAIAAAATQIPHYRWIGIGFDAAQRGNNFEILPYVNNPTVYLEQAAVVVGNTGNNSVLEVGRCAKPFITLPEWRFFDEQAAKAQMLEQHGLAVVLSTWPATRKAWQQVLAQAIALKTSTWSQILAGDGAAQAANYIQQQLERVSVSPANHLPAKSLSA